MPDPIYDIVSDEKISSVVAATGFTASKLTSQVTYAVVQAITAPIRFRISGSDPTSSQGLRLTPGDIIEVWGTKAMTQFRAINDGGTATVEVIYMGRGAP